MPSPLAEAFLMGILNGCYETPSQPHGCSAIDGGIDLNRRQSPEWAQIV